MKIILTIKHIVFMKILIIRKIIKRKNIKFRIYKKKNKNGTYIYNK